MLRSMMMKIPSKDEMHPKSLWPYYNMLPDQIRNDPIVRRTFMALEYHHFTITLENK